MKTVMWLYLFMFIASFDLHAQYPILTPFAVSLGAVPSFIGLIMGVYSITHLPGNVVAGYTVDRYGSKYLIVGSLMLAGFLLIIQAQITDPYDLLVVRAISGFVLAFLSPACLTMLAKLAKDQVHQGKLMSGNGLVHTLASVVSPAAGALLVAKVGFAHAFTWLGWALIATSVFAIFGIQEVKRAMPTVEQQQRQQETTALTNSRPIPWLFFGIPLALSCSQGILFFELPFVHLSTDSIMSSGLLFAIVSLGSLVTLSMLFLNRYSSMLRTMIGSLLLALIFFVMATNWKVPLEVSLFAIGMTQGVIYPSIATMFAGLTPPDKYGKVFSFLSIAYSVGAFIGPILAGVSRNHISPYYLAFCVLMFALMIVPLSSGRYLRNPTAITN